MKKLSNSQMINVSGGAVKCIYIAMASAFILPFISQSVIECATNAHRE